MLNDLKIYRNYFPLKFGWQCSCGYGNLYPVFRKMMYPGDVFKVHADLLIRYQPLLAPPMNNATAKVRFGFIPLRLLEENTELVVTGSSDGHLTDETIPVMDSVFKYLDLTSVAVVEKDSILDLLYGIPVGLELTNGLLTKLEASKSAPAAYFAKGYYRFYWDYYRDENLLDISEFEDLWEEKRKYLHCKDELMSANLKKDRFVSSMPWQLKAYAVPTIEVLTTGTFTPNYNGTWINPAVADPTPFPVGLNGSDQTTIPFNSYVEQEGGMQQNIQTAAAVNSKINTLLNVPQEVTGSGVGFNAAMVRELMAQTRIFERLARTGSRYTEYLKANFGVAPSDGTLQRTQYLGGFKTHIVTTEVVQTAAATNESGNQTPVGTLRGHGITHGNSTIKPYMAKEIGIMIALLDVQPETIYANGVDRELTYRSRFDFLNPSFQHLSEQEVRKGEIFFGVDTDSDGNLKNDETWGFQPYAQELRTGVKHVVGDMRDDLSFWNQALIMSSRPALNSTFIAATTHNTSFNRPFAVSGADAKPMVIDFGGLIEAYRPLVKDGNPGLVDHN